MKYPRVKVSDEEFLEAVKSSKSMSEASRKLGYRHLGAFHRRAVKLGVWKANVSGRGIAKHKLYKTPEQVFVTKKAVPTGILSTYLKQEREWKCECCGLTEWQGKPLTLELHHIDGDRTNNIRENLQILCPNCHSQTENWRARKLKGQKTMVSDEDFLEAIEREGNIGRGLQVLGLAGGANYYRAQRLLAKKHLKEQNGGVGE